MADAGEAAAGSQAAAAAAPQISAPLTACSKPDREAFEATLGTLNTEVEEMQKKRNSLIARIQASKGSNDELNAKLQEARTRFAAIK